MQSNGVEQVRSVVVLADVRGKHRISAELKRLEQETRFLEKKAAQSVLLIELLPGCNANYHESQMLNNRKYEDGVINYTALEELEQLEKLEKASASCKELTSIVESRPDPLLPETNGPIIQFWDRWFQGPQESAGCKCWIL